MTAFQDVVERHEGVVRGFLRRRLGNPALADEATQETFVRAYAKQETLRDPAKMGSWLLGIARRVSAEARRGHHRSIPVAEVADDALGLAPSPETELLDRESCGALARAVGELRADRREALLLRVDDELGYDDIASRLGWTLAKVKNEIHRARREIERAIAAGLAIVALAASAPQLGTIGNMEVALLDDSVPACFESGLGAAAATESSFRACLLASPLLVDEPSACLDVLPVCGG